MPSVFDKKFKRSGFPSLLKQFGEPVVYTFRAGGTRNIDAVIERSPPEIFIGESVVLPSFMIRFYDDETDGVRPSEIDTGGDTVSLIAEFGDSSNSTFTVLKIVSQDSGVVQIALK